MIEKGKPASGPTGRSSAITHAFYLMPELSQLAIRGVDILRQIPKLTGEGKVHHEVGMMWVCGPDAEKDWLAAAERIRSEGSEIKGLAPSDVQKQLPSLNIDGLSLALWEPHYGYGDAYGAANALVTGARQRGCTVMLDTLVSHLIVKGSKVEGVVTVEHGVISAPRVIAAAGVWTKPLISQAGVDLPIFVERHEMAVLEGEGRARAYLPFAWCDDTMCSYARPDGERVILAGTWSGGGTGIRRDAIKRPARVSDPEHYKEGVDEAESVDILSYLVPRMPQLEQLGLRPGYAGLYDMSPDDNPIVDGVPGIEGLTVVCGSSGHGFKIGAAIGEEAARLAMTGTSRLLAPFNLDRFAK